MAPTPYPCASADAPNTTVPGRRGHPSLPKTHRGTPAWETHVLRFCTDTRIWPTNLSERDLRPTKTQQKI
jgi:hypothetical protein